jgi:3,4-dihydroxy 2-butanone 4-phosphate synthase
MSQKLGADVRGAIEAFAAGEPVLVHDFASREGEIDLVYPAADVDAPAVARLRNDAGGLVCVALAADVADAFELPFLAEAVDHPAAGGPVAYDDRSSFSLSVNHVDAFTGITDHDRALTIGALADAARRARDGEYDVDDFAASFRVPGHVHLLRAAGSLEERRGHTELAIALAAAADREPAAVVCEMLDDTTGEALPVDAAREYARRHGLVFVEGSALVESLL